MNVYDYELDLNGEVDGGIEVDGVGFFIKESDNPELSKARKTLNEDNLHLDICPYFHQFLQIIKLMK